MRLLLDTHAFLWFITGSNKLSPSAREAFESPANTNWVSIATLWEMVIKASLGKLTLGRPFRDLVTTQLAENGFSLLQVEVDHLAALMDLPYHHRDLFDRLLVAQCTADDLALVTCDSAFSAYDVRRIW